MNLSRILLTVLALSACGEPYDSKAVSDASPAANAAEHAETSPSGTASTAPASGADTALSPNPEVRSVRVGLGGLAFNMCAGTARVGGLNSRDDTVLSVREAPSQDARERDRLDPDSEVIACEGIEGWQGIVYPREGQTLESCDPGRPISRPTDYDGPCRSGWVDSALVTLLAD